MIVVELEPGDGHPQLFEIVPRYIPQIRMGHPKGDLLLGGELAP